MDCLGFTYIVSTANFPGYFDTLQRLAPEGRPQLGLKLFQHLCKRASRIPITDPLRVQPPTTPLKFNMGT